MKFTLTSLIYWFSIAGFSCGAILCLYYLLRETGIISSVLLPPGGEQPRKLENCWSRMSRFFLNEWFEKRRLQIREFGDVLLLVVASRILIILIGNMAQMLLHNSDGSLLQLLSWMWTRWDSGHYLDIARHGYLNVTEERFFIVFFPFYPFLTHLFALVLRSYEWAGVAVANLSLLVASFYLYRLIRLDFSRNIARTTVILLLFGPFSFFLGIVYSDSLFLALSILTFYYLRKGDWITASFWGFLASLTRNFGILLVVPAVIEFLIATDFFERIKSKDYTVIKTLWRDGLYLLGIPLGFGAYLLINKLVTGDWFRFTIYQQEHWCHRFSFFAVNLADIFGYLLSAKPNDQIAMWFPEVSAIVLVMGLLFYGFRKIRLSYLIYILLYLLVCLSTTWLISGSRYLMALFPVYLLLALLFRGKNGKLILIATSVALLTIFTIAFVMDFNVV
jgi:Gpi18-like mannosyltransferase